MCGSLILVIACLPLIISRSGPSFVMRDARQPIHRSFKGFGIDPPVPRHRPRQYPIANPLPIGCNAYSSAFSRLFICQPALLHPVLVHRPRCATKSSSIATSALVTPTRHRQGQPGRGHLWQPKVSSRGKGCTQTLRDVGTAVGTRGVLIPVATTNHPDRSRARSAEQ